MGISAITTATNEAYGKVKRAEKDDGYELTDISSLPLPSSSAKLEEMYEVPSFPPLPPSAVSPPLPSLPPSDVSPPPPSLPLSSDVSLPLPSVAPSSAVSQPLPCLPPVAQSEEEEVVVYI